MNAVRAVSIYCSGSIAKGRDDTNKLLWTDKERSDVAEGARPDRVVFLNPDDPITDRRNVLGQFGRDMFQVMVATAVIVDARERRGIGIGVEMAAAAAVGTPVIVVAPLNTQYRLERLHYRGTRIDNYVHPHVKSLAYAVVDDFEAAGRLLAALPPAGDRREKVPTWLEPAISEYENNVLRRDQPMLTALADLDRDSKDST